MIDFTVGTMGDLIGWEGYVLQLFFIHLVLIPLSDTKTHLQHLTSENMTPRGRNQNTLRGASMNIRTSLQVSLFAPHHAIAKFSLDRQFRERFLRIASVLGR